MKEFGLQFVWVALGSSSCNEYFLSARSIGLEIESWNGLGWKGPSKAI